MAEQLRVFVSHATEDSAFCHIIVAALRGAGADVWYDEHNMGSGRLADEILRELGRRPIFVVILSKHAFASRWVKRETDWAEELKERDPSRATLPVTAEAIARDDFGTENGWLAYYTYKRVEAPGFAPFAPDEAAQRLLHALGLTPAGEAPAPIAPQPSESADDLLTRGKALIAQDKYTEALPLLERATQLAPNSFSAWANLGLARNETGRHDDDLQAYDRALALDDKQAWVWNNKGIALDSLERYEETLVAYERALALDPNYAIAWNNKGGTLIALKRYDEALAAYEQALALDPNYAKAWYNKGYVLDDLERYEEALVAFDRALALNPNDADTWTNKGISLENLKRYEAALTAYDKALALNPNDAQAWYNKGHTLERLNRYAEALAAYEHGFDPNDARDWQGKARCLRGLGRTAEAEEAERRAKALEG